MDLMGAGKRARVQAAMRAATESEPRTVALSYALPQLKELVPPALLRPGPLRFIRRLHLGPLSKTETGFRFTYGVGLAGNVKTNFTKPAASPGTWMGTCARCPIGTPWASPVDEPVTIMCAACERPALSILLSHPLAGMGGVQRSKDETFRTSITDMAERNLGLDPLWAELSADELMGEGWRLAALSDALDAGFKQYLAEPAVDSPEPTA